MDAFWAAPPVTRTLAAAIFVESILAAIGIVGPRLLIFHSSFIFTFPPEIWRLVTSFCLTGGLGIIMTPFFVWQYAAPLEKSSSRFNSASFFVYILFVGIVILLLSNGLLGGMIFTNALTLAITYTFAQENRGRQVQFFIVPMQVQFLPYAMLLLTLAQGGPGAAMSEAVGIPAAHLYDFLTVHWPQYGGGQTLIPTPAFLERWFYGSSGSKRTEVKGHGTAFRANPQPASSGSSSGYSNPWSSRGQGRRLGE